MKKNHIITISAALLCLVVGYYIGASKKEEAVTKSKSPSEVVAFESKKTSLNSDALSQNTNLKTAHKTDNAQLHQQNTAAKLESQKVITDPRVLAAIKQQTKNRQLSGNVNYDWNDPLLWKDHIENTIYQETTDGLLHGKADVKAFSCVESNCTVSYAFYDAKGKMMLVSKLLKDYQTRADIVGVDQSAQVSLNQMYTNEDGVPIVDLNFKR
jgi:hypothetical protein